jgi:hypothetical protein
MKQLFTVITILSLSICQGQWLKTYGGSSDENAQAIKKTSDGGYIIAGQKNNYGWLLKTDLNGDTLWSKKTGFSSPQTQIYDVDQISDGSYIVGGYETPFFSESQALAKIDSSGDSIWHYTKFNVGAIYSVEETFDGGYISCGYINKFSEEFNLFKANSNGDTVWVKDLASGNFCRAFSIKQTTDSGYIFTGKGKINGVSSLHLIKTDINGDTLWTNILTDSSEGSSVLQTYDGGYVVAGQLKGDLLLMKTNANGTTLWTKTYGATGMVELGKSVKQTNDGGFIIVGNIDNNINTNIYIIKTDSSGNVLWDKVIGGCGDYYGNDIEIANDGGYVIAGTTDAHGNGGEDILLIKVASSGSLNMPACPFDISGSVKDTLGNPSAWGSLILLKRNGMAFDTVKSTLTKSTGNFDFYNIDTGSYLISTMPSFTDAVKTYYKSAFSWENATRLNLTSDTANINITALRLMNKIPDQGYLSGQLLEGYLRGPSDPIDSIVIGLIRTDTFGVYDLDTTDANGFYEFNNIGCGVYKVVPEILGKTPDTSVLNSFNLCGTDTVSAIFIVDSNHIYIELPLTNIRKNTVAKRLRVYPNPTKDILYIETGSYAGMKKHSLSITNNLGQQVFSTAISKELLSVNVAGLGKKGVYFLQVLDANRNVVEFKYIVLQ